MARRSTSTPNLTKQVAEQLATTKTEKDSKTNITDYGFANTQVPQFKGEVKEYMKWRRQVEGYLTTHDAATTSTQAVQHLDTTAPNDNRPKSPNILKPMFQVP